MTLVAAASLQAQVREEDRRFKLAQGYEAGGDLKNAARVYKELYDGDPRSNIYFEGVRRTYMAMLRFAELLPIVETRLASDSDNVELRSLHADLLSRNRRRDEALAEWRAALDLRPRDELSYVIVANAQTENRLFEDAVATYRLGRERLNDRSAFGDQLAQLYGMLGRFEESAAEYVAMLAAGPNRLGYVMGGFGMFTTNPAAADAAIRVVKRASDARPDFVPYLDLLEWLYGERGDLAGSFEVAKRLDDVRGAHGSNIYAFADRALRDGNVQAALDAFDYFMKTYPKENPLYGASLVGYARSLERRYRDEGKGKRSDAEEIARRYRELVDDYKGSPSAADALMELARIQANDLDEPRDALSSIGRLRDDYPRYPGLQEATLLEGELQLRIGELDRARATFRSAANAPFSNNPDARRFRDMSALRYAEILFYTGAFKEAVDSLTALTDNTGSEATNDALQYLFLLQENLDKNDAALKHYAAGSLDLVQRKWKDAIGEMEQTVTADADGTLADEALMGKARAQEGMGEPGQAVETLLELVQKYHDGTVTDRALFRAAQLAETALGDTPRALELYTRLLTEFPVSPMVNQARQRIRVLRGNS